MPVPTDLRILCSALEHFHLPAALGNLRDDCFVVWNPKFRETAELSEEELGKAKLTSLIALDQSYAGTILRDGDSDIDVNFVPCALKRFGKFVAGSALRRDDGLVMVILNLPAGDLALQDFIRGRLIGREEEKNRTRQFLHDILSSKLLVASFATHEVYQRLAASGAEGTQELAMATKLLREVIDSITEGFDEQLRSERIPDDEAANLQRLMNL